MAWITRPSRPQITVGLEIVPPALLIVTGQPWLGAATLGGVLMLSAVQSWIMARSAEERQRAILSYAQGASSMGVDPAPVIAALCGNAGEDGDSPPRIVDETRDEVSPPPHQWSR